MELNERQQNILNLLHENGKISVNKLSKILNYSEMTVRRDLTKMEKAGLLKRSHGMALENDIQSQPITTRSFAQDGEKRTLSKEASKYLSDNITVFLDSSSTCIYLIPYIAEKKNITIFTNSVQVLLSAANFHIPCYLTGGKYFEKDMCLLGPQAEKFAENINADIAFFSCAGYTEDGKITDDSEEQTAVRLAAMKNAKKIIMLFDSTKKNLTYAFTVCRKENIFKMITV
ncbi:MAG: DeoR/GlpR transcriptional regulator [Ruminococcaceae bacterium]|nr:DeoR/GlpR transcriptional regulator [Oscillospiraceae bacterium]